MKLNRIFIVIAILITSFAYPQEVVNNQGEETKIRGINEISYQMPLSFGYNHIQNFNDKLLIGAGLHIGFGVYFLRYVDLFQFKVFTRNVFYHNKFNRKIDYDIGLFFSFPALDMGVYYGITTSIHYNFWKMKIGINLLSGAIQDDGKIENFPNVMFTPSFIYKF
jgi:hypothetical protein